MRQFSRNFYGSFLNYSQAASLRNLLPHIYLSLLLLFAVFRCLSSSVLPFVTLRCYFAALQCPSFPFVALRCCPLRLGVRGERRSQELRLCIGCCGFPDGAARSLNRRLVGLVPFSGYRWLFDDHSTSFEAFQSRLTQLYGAALHPDHAFGDAAATCCCCRCRCCCC